jgi:hypothetical protein
MRWRVLLFLLASSCPAPPGDGALLCGTTAEHACPDGFRCVEGRCYTNGHVFDLGQAPVDMTAASDEGPPADIAQVVVHFYPDLQLQIDRYDCPMCHGSAASPRPHLFTGDTPVMGRNYSLRDYAGPSLVTKIQDVSHCADSCVGAADIRAWQQWVANPVL